MDEDERGSSTRIDSVDFVTCAREINRYIERDYIGRFRKKFTRIQDSRRVFGRYQEGVWRRR